MTTRHYEKRRICTTNSQKGTREALPRTRSPVYGKTFECGRGDRATPVFVQKNLPTFGVPNNSIACCITRELTWLDQSTTVCKLRRTAHYRINLPPLPPQRERERESIKSERPCPRRAQVIQPTADQNTMPITLDQKNITTRSRIPPLLSESKVSR